MFCRSKAKKKIPSPISLLRIPISPILENTTAYMCSSISSIYWSTWTFNLRFVMFWCSNWTAAPKVLRAIAAKHRPTTWQNISFILIKKRLLFQPSLRHVKLQCLSLLLLLKQTPLQKVVKVQKNRFCGLNFPWNYLTAEPVLYT